MDKRALLTAWFSNKSPSGSQWVWSSCSNWRCAWLADCQCDAVLLLQKFLCALFYFTLSMPRILKFWSLCFVNEFSGWLFLWWRHISHSTLSFWAQCLYSPYRDLLSLLFPWPKIGVLFELSLIYAWGKLVKNHNKVPVGIPTTSGPKIIIIIFLDKIISLKYQLMPFWRTKYNANGYWENLF